MPLDPRPPAPPRSARRGIGLVLACLLLGAAGCAGGGLSLPGLPDARGVPGFDTRDYPGADVMAGWMAESPYRWVGYYLASPCYTGTTWTGRRRMLRSQGWGLAVVYVGEQDWAAMGAAGAGEPHMADSAAVEASEEAPRCTRSNLTDSVGTANGRAAVRAMAEEGFPAGTVVHLDVERVASVSPELLTYVEAWVDAVLEDGRFVPGLYAHTSNVGPLRRAVVERYARAGVLEKPPLWVAGSGSFSLRASPVESGVPDADVWQGVFDVEETWDGVTLRIDRNVADSPDPSGPGG